MLNRRPSRIEVKPEDRQEEYDDSRRAHVERLKQQIALQGPSPSGLDDGDDDGGFVNAHHPLLQRPTTDARIGFIPPPHPPSHQ
ncbi:unnamed protein product [Bathycoccus prasinos]